MSKVSAIMPVYNRERYVAYAIESVLAQSYDNFELIVVDDGSTDESRAIIMKFKSQYPDKIKVLFQENQGAASARNFGISKATGELIAFIDSDDLWARDKLKIQTQVYDEKPDSGFIYSGYYLIDEIGTVIKKCTPDIRLQGSISDKLFLLENDIHGGTMVASRRNLNSIGCFDVSMKGGENFDLRIRLSKLGGVYFTEALLSYYRKHDQCLTANSDHVFSAWENIIKKHFDSSCQRHSSLYNKVVSRHNYNIGVDKFTKMHLLDAIPYFIKSIAYDPKRTDSYFRLIRCFLGRNLNKVLSNLGRSQR